MTALGDRLVRMWMPRVGGFVWTDDQFGIGKLVELGDGKAVVEIRRSVVNSEHLEYKTSDLRHAYLPLQSRVYHERNGAWYLGRVLVRYVDGTGPASYLVKYPGFPPVEMREEALSVRCLLPLQEPVEVLASWALEPQFLADHRDLALAALSDARRISRSLGGLLAASVELLPHQVEVVRRVTEDPIQRYLLADEVGMGKTIEACAVLRQALLDNAQARVVVAVPRSLLTQWRSELSGRFAIGEDDERVLLIPFDELTPDSAGQCDLLIVDEAHHLIGRGPGWQSPEYRRLAAVAHAAPKLLLLSATPVLADENATLALLHLLDPQVFRLTDAAGFRERLHLRQQFGRVLLGLDPDAPPFLLQQVLDEFLALAPEDEVAASLVSEVSKALETAIPEGVRRSVRALRDHIAETYRLNQRLLRTRRRDVEGWEIPRRTAVLACISDTDSSVHDAWDVLDDWREQAASALAIMHEGGQESAAERVVAARYARLVEALGMGADAFAALLSSPASDAAEVESGYDSIEGLRARASEVASRSNPVDRARATAVLIDRALRELEKVHGRNARLVAFSSDGGLVSSVPAELARLRGFGVAFTVTSAMSPAEVEASIARYWAVPAPAVLICDRAGEEGLNLQRCHGIVHVDLPLDPLRVEQRIGRLDRIGRASGEIHHWVQLPSADEASPWQQWLRLLQDAFGVFEGTIADIQFVLDAVLDGARLDLLYGRLGTPAVRQRIADALADERRRLDEQFALDQLEIGEADAGLLFDRLRETESTDRKFAKAMSGWWERVLRLERFTPDDSNGDPFILKWRDSTLAPREPWQQEVEEALDVPLTYERKTALERPGVRLVRSGNALVEVLPRFLRYDDRGTAFATWRTEPRLPDEFGAEWLGFRLTYAVELDADAIVAGLGETARVSLGGVRRRADLIFAPWVETVFVGSSLEPVIDPVLLKILRRQYQRDGPYPGAGDLNLADARSALADVLDPRRFVELCSAIKGRRQQLVEDRPEYQERLAEAQSRARTELTARAERLERRATAQRREFGETDSTASTEAAISRAITAALDRPLARLDSVGLMVVARSRPGNLSGS
jgi:ATP-dependent helicase HepA